MLAGREPEDHFGLPIELDQDNVFMPGRDSAPAPLGVPPDRCQKWFASTAQLGSRGERLLSERSLENSLTLCKWQPDSSAAFASDERRMLGRVEQEARSPEDGELAEAKLKAIKESLEAVGDTMKWLRTSDESSLEQEERLMAVLQGRVQPRARAMHSQLPTNAG